LPRAGQKARLFALPAKPDATERVATATRSAARITAAERSRFAAPATRVAHLNRVAAADIVAAVLAQSAVATNVAPKEIFAVTKSA
jgi:hypothetical protein